MIRTVLILAVAVAVSSQTPSQVVRNVVASREDMVSLIASKAKIAYLNRCASSVRSCSTCTPDSCSTYTEGYNCTLTYGNAYPSPGPNYCSGDQQGRKLDLTRSSVRIPAKGTYTETRKEDVCAMRRLDNQAFMPNMINDSSIAWQYFGSLSAVFRQYPASISTGSGGYCSSYDPRIRPWFTTAASGPKNVILVLDKSGSMTTSYQDSTRWDVAVEAASAVIQSISSVDWLGVVTFSGSSSSARQFQAQLVPGTDPNKASAISWLVEQSPSGGTSFSSGLQLALDILTASIPAEKATSCQTTVLFLTDGEPTDDPNDSYNIVSQMVSRTDFTSVFSFSFGPGANAAVMKRLACVGGGVWQAVSGTGDLLSEMTSYFQFLAALRGDVRPRWSDKYIDASGLGEMVTVSIPVFDGELNTTSLPLLVGVAGVDVTIRDITSKGVTEVEFLDYISSKSATCSTVIPTACQLQVLRQSSNPQSVCTSTEGSYPNPTTCSISQEERASCGATIAAASVTCPGERMTEGLYAPTACCEFVDTGLIVGAVLGGVIGAILIFGGLYYYCRVRRAKSSVQG
jgi:uncharacterized protein YegL